MGKFNKIIIINDKGCLSKVDIERMVNEVEKYKEEDDKQCQRIVVCNQLEFYVFIVKQVVEDIGDKFQFEDKEIIFRVCSEIVFWFDNNVLVEVDEYEFKLKEVQKVCLFIMVKLYQNGFMGN